MSSLKNILASASQFDVYKWSDYPQVKLIVDDTYDEVVRLRRSRGAGVRIRGDKYIRKHMRVLLINLYISHLSFNPWVGVSKRKPDYIRTESRYRKIFLTYDYLIPLINDLVSLGYVKESRGFYDATQGRGMRTRIRARSKLTQRIEDAKYGLQECIAEAGLTNVFISNPEEERELIILRDANKKNKEYEDTDETNAMRENLRLINANILQSSINLSLSDEQKSDLRRRLLRSHDEDREPIDFSRVTLARVFNEDFDHGGRFYGGWWIGLPKAFRQLITIDSEQTNEVDYSAHHIRMMYAMVDYVPEWNGELDDPYALINGHHGGYTRNDVKLVFLILLNTSSKRQALKACASKRIANAEAILADIESTHQPIKQYFYSGIGTWLQNQDSQIAEQVMLRLNARGIVALPVHDSFIVKSSNVSDLELTMEEVFMEMFYNNIPSLTGGSDRDNHRILTREEYLRLID